MKFTDYIRQLLPVFGKDRAQEDSRITRTEIVSVTIASYAAACEPFKSHISSSAVNDLNRRYKLMMGSVQGNMVLDIYARLKKLPPVLDAIDEQLSKDFEAKIIPETLTARRANVLRVLEHMGFVSKYALSLLNWIIVEEGKALKAELSRPSDITPGEEKRLTKYFADFCLALKTMSEKIDPRKAFDEIPEVQLEGIEGLGDVFGDNKIDPFGFFKQSNFKGSPIYFVRDIVAQWQMERYKHTQEQKKLLELRLLHLKRRQEGSNDAGAEREIELLSAHVASIAERLRKQEESFA